MRNKFPGFYRPTEEEFDEIWKDGLIILDTNMLSNLYGYNRHANYLLADELCE